ncbi:MAG: TonB-dependent receptor [Gammaproteobacteria bacterium]|nr:MAG: TonB-dependent receptor [Gammaproteobacteria bacterium]
MKTRWHASPRRRFSRLPIAAAIQLACFTPLIAAEAPQSTQPETSGTSAKTQELGAVTVTAQKRTENVQAVPISMDVLSTEKLTEMNVASFTDYLKLLPGVSMQPSQEFAPGFMQVYMRGVSSGSNGNHSGPLPSVGVYLDEQPITTTQGALDLHIYDLARVEALAGPQGTLYGASSQAGTIRLITNKPDPSAFAASVSTEVNSVDHGGTGYIVEGYINLPLRENMALRASGWDKKDAGYIDNVHRVRTYPTSGIVEDNANRVKDDYNTARTRGARAALKIDLNDSWSVTPTVMGQSERTQGVFAYDKTLGPYKVAHNYPENSEDRWIQSALTVQGKIGNFDVTYAFSHLDRNDHTDQDYNDYGFWYDAQLGYGAYITDNAGNLINPAQFIHGEDGYKKTSHELRVASPKDQRLRFVTGIFAERQSHDILQRYQINNLGSDISVPGWPNTIWLTRQLRRDNDSALFGELSYDITDQLTATVGSRWFHTEDSLKGFFGFGAGFSGSTGEAACFPGAKPYKNGPCLNLDKETKETDSVGKANLTYKLDSDKMLYATWSEGFRPGGINRRGTLPPYKADFLTNWELGWKTEWLDHHLRWNGAVFQENWKDFQVAVLGLNSLTEIKNASQARIRGFESTLTWAATYNLLLSGGIALYKSELTKNYCGFLDENENPVTDCPASADHPEGPQAPKGTALPIVAKQKGTLSARYSFDLWGLDAYAQGALFFEGRRRSDLRNTENQILGELPGYGTVDLTVGAKKDKWAFDVYLKNALDRNGHLAVSTQCAIALRTPAPLTICGNEPYIFPVQPRTIGVRVTRDF